MARTVGICASVPRPQFHDKPLVAVGQPVIAVFDIEDFLPYLRHMRRIAVTYGVHGESDGLPATRER